MKLSQMLCLMMLLAVVSFSFAQDISIEDFRIPVSQYKRLFVGLDGNLNSNSTGGDPNSNYSNGSNSLGISLSNTFGYNSEEKSFLFSLTGNGEIGRTNNKNQYANYTPAENTSEQRREGLTASLQLQYSSYVTPDKIYWYASSQNNGYYSLYRHKDDTNGVNRSTNFDKQRRFDVSLGAGVGYGKVREGSSVFAVVRIIEKLMEDGYLTRDLTKEEILMLVEKYEKRVVYNYEHERPAKYILRDLFEELIEKGLLTNQNAFAYATSRTDEVLHESIYPRIFGWTIQTGLQVRRYQYNYSSTYSLGEALDREMGNDWVIQATYGYPLSLYLDWYSQAGLAVPIYGKQNRVDQYVSTYLYCEISERISTKIGCLFSKGNTYQESRNSVPTYNFGSRLSPSAEFYYFLEDALNFNITASYSDYLTKREPSSLQSRYVQDSYAVTFGLSYRIF